MKLRTSLGLDPIVRNVQLQAKKHVLRSRPLSHIHAFFNDLPEEALPICGIWGGSGTGKTELAKSYAHQYASEYHHICAIDGKNWQQGYKRLAQDWKVWPENYPSDVDLSHEDNRPLLEMVIRAVHQKLDIAHGYLGTKRSLLIFDDISPDFFQRCLFNQLPTKHTDILVTSTKKSWEHEVDMSNTAFRLTIDEGKAILRGWVSQDRFDPDEAKKIVTEMEHLPLLLALAGSYLSQIRTLPLKDYLPRFRKERRKVMETGGQSLQHAGLVASIEMVVEKLSPQSKHLLGYCAYLPPKDIPIPFLQKLLGFSAIDLDAALASLSAFLVGSSDTLAIHNNYQQILQGMELLSDAELSLMAEYIDEKNNLFLSASHNAIKILEASIHHAEKSCHYEKMVNLTAPLTKAYSRVGGYGTLLETLKQVLEIVDKQIGDKDLLRATIYNNVGYTYGQLGNHMRALEHLQKAVSISELVLGELHPTTIRYRKDYETIVT